MASAPASASLNPQVVAAIRAYCAQHCQSCGAAQFGLSAAELAEMVAEVVSQWNSTASDVATRDFLATLRLEELVLARACAAGDNHAWEVFLNRYRATLYESAYKIAQEEST